MQVDTNVSESDIGDVRDGETADFGVDAFPDRVFQGVVGQVRQVPITVQNVMTYDVVVNVANPELLLKPGMTANVTIITARRDDVLRVPLQALAFSPTSGAHAAIRRRAGAAQPARSEPAAMSGCRGRRRLQPVTDRERTRRRPLCRSHERRPQAGRSGRNRRVAARRDHPHGSARRHLHPHSARALSITMPAVIEIDGLNKTYRMGEVEVQRAAGRQLYDRARRVRRDHGRVGLGQIDPDEHHRMPRSAHQRPLPARRRRCRLA